MTPLNSSLSLGLIAIGTLAAQPATPVAAELCMTDWGRAGEIVRSQQLITVEELSGDVLPNGEGQILKSMLCQRDGDYVYRLVVRDKAGKLRNTVVPARRR